MAAGLRLVALIVDGVSFGQHALMQDARNQNTPRLLTIKHNVLAMLQTAQAMTNILTESARRGIVGKRLATNLKLGDVTGGLGFAPGSKGVIADAQQVGLSTTRKTKRSHGLARRVGKLEGLPHTAKYVALSNAAGVAFVNGRP